MSDSHVVFAPFGKAMTDRTGEAYNSWTIIGYAGKGRWWAQCQCGAIVDRTFWDIKTTTQCRTCHDREAKESAVSIHPESKCWYGMLARCYWDKHEAFSRYGGAGIVICDEWRDAFFAFLRDVGPRPDPDLQIDRINNNGNYSCGHCEQCRANNWPANCRWATRHEQSVNRKTNVFITFRGETHCVKEWARILGMNHSTLQMRLSKYKMSIEEALTRPVSPNGRLTHHFRAPSK